MCEAKNLNEIKLEVIELREDLLRKIDDWKHHFEWLNVLKNAKKPEKSNLSKYAKIRNGSKILVNILRNNIKNLESRFRIKLNSLKPQFRIFLKNYYQKRENGILKKVDKIQSKFNKKIEKQHSRLVIFREKRFQEMMNLGEMI